MVNERGLSQVKVWVPKYMVPWLHQLGKDARALHSLGIDPLPFLPESIKKAEKERDPE